ncbi:MAG: O-antigen ligase [Crocinitomix sp.]|jgi:O-antigen ligase
MLNEFKKRNFFEAAEFTLTLLFAFFLLIDQKIATYIIAGLGLNALIQGIRIGFRKPPMAYYPFVILFVCYLIGLFFTENFDYGSKDIETRLTFLLFPLFYGTFKRKMPLNKSWIIWFFIAGALLYLAINWYKAYDCFEIVRNRTCFESYALSRWIHPTYAAMYLVVGSALALADAFGKNGNVLKKIAALLISCVFYFFVYKFYSLGPWISFVGMVATILFALFYFRKKMAWFFVGIAVMATVGVLAIQNLDLLASDYKAVKTELSDYFNDKEAYIAANSNSAGSVNARLLIWNTSFQMIADHPFGVGTGDGKDVLMEYYYERGMNVYAEKQLNPHCQYLQTAGSIGIVPALFLIASLIYYLILGFKRKDYFLIILISAFATGCLFESVLERQWGILFFLFFLILFINNEQELKEDDVPA